MQPTAPSTSAAQSTLGAAEPRPRQLSSRRSARKRQTCGLVALFGASRTRNGDRRGAPAAPVRCGDASNLTAFTARQLCRRSRCGVCMQPPRRAAPGEIRRRSRSAAAKGARRRRPHPPVPPPSLKLSLGDVRRRGKANLAAANDDSHACAVAYGHRQRLRARNPLPRVACASFDACRATRRRIRIECETDASFP